MYVPDCGIRQDYNAWKAAGEKNMADRINEKIANILENHKPESLPDDVIAKLDDIVRKAESRF